MALLYPITLQQFFILGRVSSPYTFVLYQVLDLQNPVDDCFWSRWTAGNIHVNRYHLVNSLKYTVRIEYSTTTCASANCHYPPRFSHLQIHLSHNRTHFLCNGTHY